MSPTDGHLINFSFSTRDGRYFPQFRLDRVHNIWEALLFVLVDLGNVRNWIVTTSSYGVHSDEVPTVSIQREGALCFLQLFLSESVSPTGEDGWWALIGSDRDAPQDPILIQHDAGRAAPDGYFRSLETPEVLVSNALLVEPAHLQGIIEHLASAPSREWTSRGEWLDLGLI